MSSEIKKRPMRRKKSVTLEKFKNTTGSPYVKVVGELRSNLRKRDERLATALRRLETLKASYDKLEHTLQVKHNREIRKLETIIRNEKKKYKAYQDRKGHKHRTVIYRKKYLTYEPKNSIRVFEKMCQDISEDVNESYITSFERVIKMYNFLEKYNEENEVNLTINHILVLYYLIFSKVGLGITSTNIKINNVSASIIRKILNELSSCGLVDKNKIKFRITLLGEALLRDLKNFTSYGRSEVMEHIKKLSGMNDE